MKLIKTISIIVSIVIILSVILVNTAVVFVQAGQVGVLTREFVNSGVVEEDFQPGWHWNLGPQHTWTIFDSTVQTLEMTRNESLGDRRGRDDVEVQSADGYAVSVDVTIKYRIRTGQTHKLYQQTGSDNKYKTLVRTQAKKACLAEFGIMKTEGFYNPDKRRETSIAVKKELQKRLQDNYVEVVDVLIKSVQFDPEYEKKIQQKKLADQEVQLNISMAKAEQMSGKRQVIEAETAKKLKIIKEEQMAATIRMDAETNRSVTKIRAEFNRFVTEKKADADLIAAENNAKGSLLVKEAEAEGERLRNEAMQGAGGSTIVALQAAKNLNIKDMVISTTDLDIFNLEKMAKRLGAQSSKK